MTLSAKQAERLNRGIDLFIERLNQGAGAGYSQQDLPYRVARMEDRNIAFGVSHRAPLGGRHPNGKKWITYAGPSVEDCDLIAQSSRSDEEVVAAFKRCVFEGIRPMRTKGGQVLDEAAINKIVSERLKVLLDEKLAALGAAPAAGVTAASSEALTPTSVVQEPESPDPNPLPRAHDVAKNPKLVKTWTERAEILGIAVPRLTVRGRIDGRWMRFAQERWRSHQMLNAAPTAEVTP